MTEPILKIPVAAGVAAGIAAPPIDLEDVMAIDPSAFGRGYPPSKYTRAAAALYGYDESEIDLFDRRGSVAIISIDGPLSQRGGWYWDGYESIRQRYEAAMKDETVRAVALKINSPGGTCSGCFETAKAMIRTKVQTGKPVLAYADEMAYSGGYALACVADEIYLPDSGGLGSVGVIGVLVDQTKYLEDLGFRVVVVASGTQKADGHPAVPLTPEVVARYRALITHLAGLFADLVGSSREMTAEQVLAKQAGCFYGAGAVADGLADGVCCYDDFLAMADKAAGVYAPKGAATNAKLAATETPQITAQRQFTNLPPGAFLARRRFPTRGVNR